MKGSLLIIFLSKHGYVKRYVDILGNALGCDAVPLNKLRGGMLGYDKILFISSVHGGAISGFKKLDKYLDAIADKTIVCGVGMLPFKKGMPERLRENTVPVAYENKMPVFYAQGGFDASELTRMEMLQISMMERQLNAATELSEEETYIRDALKTPVDEVKTANIKPLIDFLDGKAVDAELFASAKPIQP